MTSIEPYNRIAVRIIDDEWRSYTGPLELVRHHLAEMRRTGRLLEVSELVATGHAGRVTVTARHLPLRVERFAPQRSGADPRVLAVLAGGAAAAVATVAWLIVAHLAEVAVIVAVVVICAGLARPTVRRCRTTITIYHRH